MKTIEIFIRTYNSYDYSYYLVYKGAIIKRVKHLDERSYSVRINLIALYEALQHLNEPCNIIIHARVPLGFKQPKKSKNQDIILKIQTLVFKMGHILSIDNNNYSDLLDSWDKKYTKGNVDRAIENKRQTTVKPSIDNKSKVEDVFDNNIKEQAIQSSDWKSMYEELMSDDGKWVPGSGGY